VSKVKNISNEEVRVEMGDELSVGIPSGGTVNIPDVNKIRNFSEIRRKLSIGQNLNEVVPHGKGKTING